jgi:hypothetical protein
MKTIFLYLILLMSLTIHSQKAFKKNSLVVSLSEGSTWANYHTKNVSSEFPQEENHICIEGIRDPLILEYGLSDRWSIGLTSGADIFSVSSKRFYGFNSPNEKVKVTTSEFTFDIGYHVYTNKRLDLSVSYSAGLFSSNFNVNTNDLNLKYTATGTIVRFGTRARYYFYKRLGAFGMMSTYFANSSSKDVKETTIAKNYNTNINGFAIEAGLCFKIIK